MKTIGLLGGMSWESTVPYYQTINRVVAETLGGLHSAEVLLASVDFHEIERLQNAERWDEAGELLADLGVRYLADPFMTCATTSCQVYRGTDLEDDRTSQAIRETRGVVLMADGHIARTTYSASSNNTNNF